MTFDLKTVWSHAKKGPVARVVVAATQGSVPREVGASMLIGRDGLIDGTIGGGALEYEAIKTAQTALLDQIDRIDRRPLGPGLGQCCGGAVTLLTEVWTEARLGDIEGTVVSRPIPGCASEASLAIGRALAHFRDGRQPGRAQLLDGWMIEPVAQEKRHVWIWGAGHVGRAVVAVLAPLPGIAISWVDSAQDRFPDTIPEGVTPLIANNPADLVTLAPLSAEHYVLTYSHAIDLEICHRLLSRPFSFLGLIGSDTKRARFRSRLAALGHTSTQIDRMTCPIGDPSLGKHPQEIALGVATEILGRRETGAAMTEKRA